MSSLALPEEWPPSLAADEIDQDMQCIADLVPTHAKLAAAGEIINLLTLEGVGRLDSIYLGNFAITLAVSVESYEYADAFCKDYNLRNYASQEAGALQQVRMTQPEDLYDPPLPLPALVCSIKALRNEFTRQYSGAEDFAVVTHIDDWRHRR